MQADHLLVAEHFDPVKPVGVRPYGVVHASEIYVEFSPSVFEEMRQQERQLVHRERVLARPRQRVPLRWMRRGVDRTRDKFIPRVRIGTAFGRYGAKQGI